MKASLWIAIFAGLVSGLRDFVGMAKRNQVKRSGTLDLRAIATVIDMRGPVADTDHRKGQIGSPALFSAPGKNDDEHEKDQENKRDHFPVFSKELYAEDCGEKCKHFETSLYEKDYFASDDIFFF